MYNSLKRDNFRLPPPLSWGLQQFSGANHSTDVVWHTLSAIAKYR